jgi:hypothetical protein
MIGEPLVHLIKLAVTLSMAAQSLALFIDEAISRASTPEPPESHRGWEFEAPWRATRNLNGSLATLFCRLTNTARAYRSGPKRLFFIPWPRGVFQIDLRMSAFG